MQNKRIFLSAPHMSGREQTYVAEAFKTNWVAPLGPNVDAFENKVAQYVGCSGAVALSSGTSAIHLALTLLGVDSGDTVFCSSLTFAASANPIVYQKATPVFIDSETETWNMSPTALEIALKQAVAVNKLPKAVIVVNLYGQSADYDALQKLCSQYDVPIIEDAAESLGSTYKGKQSGTLGKFGIYSFNGNKIITTSGGGMLISEDLSLLNRARFLATQARDPAKHYQHSNIGYNYRLSNILAGVGCGQIEVLPERVLAKRTIFEKYQQSLGNLPGISFMPEAEFGRANRWLTVMLLDSEICPVSPYQLIDSLEASNIESRPVWKPLHMQPVFADCQYYRHGDQDVSRDLFVRGICLPSGSGMTSEEQQVIECVMAGLTM